MQTDSLEGQVTILKWIFAITMSIVVMAASTLAIYSRVQAIEIGSLQQTIKFQDKIITDNTKEIKSNSNKVNGVVLGLKENSTHLIHVIKSLTKIEKLLEKAYSRK